MQLEREMVEAREGEYRVLTDGVAEGAVMVAL